jgi:dipeptide/tripeptide permease
MPVWIQQHVALNLGSFRIPIPWYQSVSSLASIVGLPLLFWIWGRQALQRREPD